jgi:hypothetical protein
VPAYIHEREAAVDQQAAEKQVAKAVGRNLESVTAQSTRDLLRFRGTSRE